MFKFRSAQKQWYIGHILKPREIREILKKEDEAVVTWLQSYECFSSLPLLYMYVCVCV